MEFHNNSAADDCCGELEHEAIKDGRPVQPMGEPAAKDGIPRDEGNAAANPPPSCPKPVPELRKIFYELRALVATVCGIADNGAAIMSGGIRGHCLQSLSDIKRQLDAIEADFAFDGNAAGEPGPVSPLRDDTTGQDDSTGRDGKAVQAAPPAAAPADIRALVVDDNEINLIVAAEMLGQLGVDADTAESGADALEQIKSKEYHIIFMDHLMPGMDGVETTAQLRSLPGYASKVPVVALTGNDYPGAKDFFMENGLNDYLAKPILQTQLRDIVDRWLSGRTDAAVSVAPKAASAAPPATPAAPKTDSGQSRSSSEYLRALHSQLGLEVDAAMARIGVGDEAFMNVLSVFARSAAGKMDAIAKASEVQDWEALRVGVHGQKSSLANIGATALSQEARNLEQALIQKNYAYVEGLIQRFCEQTNLLAAQISGLEPAADIDETPKTPANERDRLRLREELLRIPYLLEGLETDAAIDILRSLSLCSYDTDTDALLEGIRRALEMFDYDGAEAGLRKIRKKIGN